MNKKGQLELSFGMIFSIIIIIATIAVAVYFIFQFLSTSKCTNIVMTKSDLQSQIDNVWKSSQAQQIYTLSFPTNIKSICFGNLSSGGSAYSNEYIDLRRYSLGDSNLFLSPSTEACDGKSAQTHLNHIVNTAFFCVPLKEGKGKIMLLKESSQLLVKITSLNST